MLELFGDVFERVRSDYVEEVPDEELIEAAIEGMLVHLDPHSAFLNKRKFRDMQVQTKGEQRQHPAEQDPVQDRLDQKDVEDRHGVPPRLKARYRRGECRRWRATPGRCP